MTKREEVFISFSDDDKKYFYEMKHFIDLLKIDCNIKHWHCKLLEYGDKWDENIHKHMAVTKVGVLMVSQAFLASGYIRNQELPILLQAAKDNQICIMWIPIKPSTVKFSPIDLKNGDKVYIDKYQAVCNPEKPLSTLRPSEREDIYVNLYHAIRRYFESN